MSSRWIPRITGPGNGGFPPAPPAEQEYFAPKYIVGNIPAGDSAVGYSVGGFTYVPDTGDGSGIEAALVLAAIVPGDIWIRPGTYTRPIGATRFIVPGNTRVWGAGRDLVTIIAGPDDNCIWHLNSYCELAWMTLVVPNVAPAPVVGLYVIYNAGALTSIHDLLLDANAADIGATLKSGIYYSSGTGGPRWSRLYNCDLIGPDGNGDPDPSVMYANIRGEAGFFASCFVSIADVTLSSGDAGVVSMRSGQGGAGPAFVCRHVAVSGPGVVGFYADGAPMFLDGDCSVVMFGANAIGGAVLINGAEYEIGSSRFLWTGAPGTIPAIIVDGPAIVSRCNVHDCLISLWGRLLIAEQQTAIAQVYFGVSGSVLGAKCVNNKFLSDGTLIVPVELGSGCTSSIVALNVGEEGSVPTVIGIDNELGHNIWVAPVPVWSPAMLTNVRLWVRADLGVTLVGADVDVWADQSGAGNDLSAAAPGARPLFVANGFNGGAQPYVEFDGVTEYIRNVAFSWPDLGGNVPAFSFSFIMEDIAAAAVSTSVWAFGAFDVNISGRRSASVTDNFGAFAGPSAGATSTSTTSLVPPRLVTYRWDGATQAIYVNGGAAEDPKANANAFTDVATRTFSVASELGGIQNGNMRVAEIIVQKEAISAPDLALLAAYATARYGV